MQAQNCANSEYFFEALFMKPEKTTSNYMNPLKTCHNKLLSIASWKPHSGLETFLLLTGSAQVHSGVPGIQQVNSFQWIAAKPTDTPDGQASKTGNYVRFFFRTDENLGASNLSTTSNFCPTSVFLLATLVVCWFQKQFL